MLGICCRSLMMLGTLLAMTAIPIHAQSTPTARLSLVALPVELDMGGANFELEGDARIALDADGLLRGHLGSNGRYTLHSLDRTEAATRTVMQSDEHCVQKACALAIGREMGADRVLLTTLTKLSNLIWFVNGFLLDTRTGEVLNTESLELKGNPADMVRGGMASFARRMSRV
jgi:hypothetical protein